MGCDIHCYVEYRRKGGSYWSDFGSRINPGRNYELFSVLAGVRGNATPLVPPRGIPSDLAFQSSYDYWIFVVEGESDGYVSVENAQRWIDAGYSKLRYPKEPLLKNWVSDPDHHTHTWLTSHEFAAAVEAGRGGLEYRALVAAVKALEDDGKNDVRVVFWFDN